MLETDWIKVATAGRTVDGREISPEMLERAGALYRAELYTATINSEHFFYPGLGTVSAVKAEPDPQGRMALWAKLFPTAEFLSRNQNKRQLFFSMELMRGFPAEGDWYLTGLAITDIPASQGLAPQLFARTEKPAECYVNTGGLSRTKEGRWEATAETTTQDPARRTPEPAGSEEPPGWFRSFLASIGWRPSAADTPPDMSKETDAMTPEEKQKFAALEAQVQTLTTTVGELTQKVQAAALPPAADKPGEGGAPRADTPEHPLPEKAAAQPGQPGSETYTQAELDAAIAEKMKPLEEKLAEFDAFMDETRATEALMVEGPSEGRNTPARFAGI